MDVAQAIDELRKDVALMRRKLDQIEIEQKTGRGPWSVPFEFDPRPKSMPAPVNTIRHCALTCACGAFCDTTDHNVCSRCQYERRRREDGLFGK